MHPTISEQLHGLARILRDVVAPDLTSSYPTEILDGVVATLDMLGDTWAALPHYLLEDAAATGEVLRLVGIETPTPPTDTLDTAAIEAHHAEVRGLLEREMPRVLADPGAEAAAVQLFRDRIDRFPFQLTASRRP